MDGRGVRDETGRSPSAGQGCPDFQEKKRVVPVLPGDALEHLGLVADVPTDVLPRL